MSRLETQSTTLAEHGKGLVRTVTPKKPKTINISHLSDTTFVYIKHLSGTTFEIRTVRADLTE